MRLCYSYVTCKLKSYTKMKISNSKIIMITSTLILILSSFSTKNIAKKGEFQDGITLNWKVSQNDTIVYRTVMKQLGESEFEMNFNQVFSSLHKIVPDSISRKLDSIPESDNLFDNDFFKKIKELYQNYNLTTYLTRSKVFEGIIDVEMIRKLNKTNDSLNEKEGFNEMLSGTQLKGSIYRNGSIHSFWLNNSQKNLVALFFQLPKKKVKIGDIWSLQDLNYIQYGNIFHCEKADKTNEVKLTGINKTENDVIAVMEYNIHEYVSGKIDFMGSLSPSQMEMSFKGKSEFSVNKGRWISYVGFLTVKSNGIMNSNSSQKLALIEE